MKARLALALTLLLAPAALADEATTTKAPYDWALVYYMAYDNNLEGCGRPILDMLGKGVTGDNIIVTCQADFTDDAGMRRYVITKDGEKVEAVPGEGSAEEETLAEYLAWTRATVRAKRVALVFLDHGGRLGQMSNDDNPGREGGQSWLEVHETSRVLADHRKAVKEQGGEVELVFLQQCGKGTLENYHAFRDTGVVVMGSQTVVGAPNSYYTDVVRWTQAHPAGTGEELAAEIHRREAPNMFTTYTTLRGAALEELPARLKPLLAPLLAKESLVIPPGLRACFDQPPDELFIDGFALLQGLYAANEVDPAPLSAFTTWASDELIAGHTVSKSPRAQRTAGTWCGFSIYVPRSKRALKRYEHYPIYRETDLDLLLEKLLTARPAPASSPKPGSN